VQEKPSFFPFFCYQVSLFPFSFFFLSIGPLISEKGSMPPFPSLLRLCPAFSPFPLPNSFMWRKGPFSLRVTLQSPSLSLFFFFEGGGWKRSYYFNLLSPLFAGLFSFSLFPPLSLTLGLQIAKEDDIFPLPFRGIDLLPLFPFPPWAPIVLR